MKKNRYPPGWNNEERVREVLARYEDQTDEEAVAEDESAFEGLTDTVMVVPKKLVPAVCELIAREHQGNNKE